MIILEILQWLILIGSTALNFWYMKKVHGNMQWYRDNWTAFNRKVMPAEYVNTAVVNLGIGVDILAKATGTTEHIQNKVKEHWSEA